MGSCENDLHIPLYAVILIQGSARKMQHVGYVNIGKNLLGGSCAEVDFSYITEESLSFLQRAEPHLYLNLVKSYGLTNVTEWESSDHVHTIFEKMSDSRAKVGISAVGKEIPCFPKRRQPLL